MKKKTRIPRKPSALIRLALKDLKAVEKDKRYIVDMGEWHYFQPEMKKCEVCLAGSVLAKTKTLPLASTRRDVPRWALALNAFREGDISHGLKHLGISKTPVPNDRMINEYDASRKHFYRDMFKLADDFEECGL